MRKEALNRVDDGCIIKVFPDRLERSTTSLILKNTKTASSYRTIFMTSALKEELKKWLNQLAADERKDPARYHDSGMLFRLPNGLAVEPVLIRKKFPKWQNAHPEFPLKTLTVHKPCRPQFLGLHNKKIASIRYFYRFIVNLRFASAASFAPVIPSCIRYPAVPVCKNVQSQNQPLKTGIGFLCKAGKTAGFEPDTAATILPVQTEHQMYIHNYDSWQGFGQSNRHYLI